MGMIVWRTIVQKERITMNPAKYPGITAFAMGLILILSSAGCGSKGQHQVKGKVVYADNADISVLAKGLVLLDPVDLDVVKSSARGVMSSRTVRFG